MHTEKKQFQDYKVFKWNPKNQRDATCFRDMAGNKDEWIQG